MSRTRGKTNTFPTFIVVSNRFALVRATMRFRRNCVTVVRITTDGVLYFPEYMGYLKEPIETGRI